MIEIRWHGRGGQGAITAAQILAKAAFTYSDKYVTISPTFGAERRGAPISASTRIADGKIYLRSSVTEPDIVIILDETLLKDVNVTAGLKKEGLIILNSSKTPEELHFNGYKVVTADATRVAQDLDLYAAGLLVVNTPILGAVIRATKLVSLEQIMTVIQERFPKDGGKNAESARRTHEITHFGENNG
ncbi:MAG: 2-oxoacid:acceptor oxidoreductase family protein [Candidatus Helarchaeota archaeon]